MPYKTILVHLNDKRRAEALLEPAVALAARNNAHLVGMHVHAAVPAPPINMPYSGQVLGAMVATERKDTEEIAAIFQRMTKGQPFVAEWRAIKVPHVDLASVVMDHGRAADLIVAGQTDPDWDLSPILDFPERLALESVQVFAMGRPLPGNARLQGRARHRFDAHESADQGISALRFARRQRQAAVAGDHGGDAMFIRR